MTTNVCRHMDECGSSVTVAVSEAGAHWACLWWSIHAESTSGFSAGKRPAGFLMHSVCVLAVVISLVATRLAWQVPGILVVAAA
jgi:hypothetical protein